MGGADSQTRRQRGEIEKLPSGSYRVKVYAGIDPVPGRRYYLTEVVPPGPRARREAEKARVRLLNEVYERRNPRTKATVAQLMERHMGMLRLEPSTLSGYQGYVARRINPLIGGVNVGGSTETSWTRSTPSSVGARTTVTASRGKIIGPEPSTSAMRSAPVQAARRLYDAADPLPVE